MGSRKIQQQNLAASPIPTFLLKVSIFKNFYPGNWNLKQVEILIEA